MLKKIYTILLLISLISLFGSISAITNMEISMIQFILQGVVSIIGFMFFTKQAGYFKNYYSNREDYLQELAKEYDLELNVVLKLADLLGEKEDYDALPLYLEEISKLKLKDV